MISTLDSCGQKSYPMYSLSSVGPGDDPGVQAVSQQVTFFISPPAAITLRQACGHLPSRKRHRFSTGTKLYCLVTEAHKCERLAKGCYADDHGETQIHDLNDLKSNALPLSHCANLG